MKYCIAERKLGPDGGRTAWSKAREDATRIASALGYEPIEVLPSGEDRVNGGLGAKLRGHFAMGRIWREALGKLGEGDTLFIQLPVIHNSLFLAGLLRSARRRGVRVVGLIHDLETLRMSLDKTIGLRSRVRMHMEETGVLRACHKLIVHNEKMRSLLEAQGVPREKTILLGIFDYLMAPETEAAVAGREPSGERDRLIVAGNLRPDKAGYVYDRSADVPLELYGVFYDEAAAGPGHRYHGALDPDELPAKLAGGFGLVWDGPAADTCRGVYGEYLRYNNPHKTSLYLASGLPVAIWDQAALADLITAENAGIAAASIGAAAEKAASLTAEEYAVYFRNAAALGERLRRGDFLKAALQAAER